MGTAKVSFGEKGDTRDRDGPSLSFEPDPHKAILLSAGINDQL